jgi:hypothetical protein
MKGGAGEISVNGRGAQCLVLLGRSLKRQMHAALGRIARPKNPLAYKK